MKVCGQEVKVQGSLIRIARLKADLYHFLDNPEILLNGLRQCGTRIDLFTFMQKLPESSPKFNYPMEWDNLAAVPVSTFDHWWTRQITPEARNRARQAEKKGVVIREVPFDDRLVKGIWEIYNESPIRQGRRFPHYGKDINTVYREEATFLDDSFFVGAFLGDKLIGFVKLTADETRTQANLMNILSTIDHRDKAPTNALIAHSVRLCAERRISYLVYQRFSYGKKQTDGIMKFKQVNGFQRFDLPRYYVPLTYVGRAALRVGLHRRFVDLLPESIVGRIRELRNAWYKRKIQGFKESA
jgi:hypothetical protein